MTQQQETIKTTRAPRAEGDQNLKLDPQNYLEELDFMNRRACWQAASKQA